MTELRPYQRQVVDDVDFDWNAPDTPVCIQEQKRTAIYMNDSGQTVIRQERAWCQEEDPFVIFNAEHLGQVIAELEILKRQTVARDGAS